MAEKNKLFLGLLICEALAVVGGERGDGVLEGRDRWDLLLVSTYVRLLK